MVKIYQPCTQMACRTASLRRARSGKGAPAEWKVLDDPTASSGRVLGQISSDRTDYRFPLAIYQSVSAANLEVTVRFNARLGSGGPGGRDRRASVRPGRLLRRARQRAGGNVNLYRVVKGVRSQIQGFRPRCCPTRHTLGIRAESDRFAVSFDGKPLFTAGHRTFSAAGKVALWTKARQRHPFRRAHNSHTGLRRARRCRRSGHWFKLGDDRPTEGRRDDLHDETAAVRPAADQGAVGENPDQP